MIRLALSFLLLLVPAQAQERSQSLQSSLKAIGAGDSAERQAAERWLAAHLGPEDLGALSLVLEQGDMEVRRRLARAIGQADRDLRLANGLLASQQPALQDVGQRALELSITAWNESGWRRGIHGRPLALHLRLLSSGSWPQVLRVPILPSLGETCALITRQAGLPLGLSVAPSVAARRPAEGVFEAVGTWDELLVRLGQIYRVSFDGHGFHPDPKQSHGIRFLRLCEATRLAEPSSEVLVRWCRIVAGEDKLSIRVAAARALANSGWNAALDWLSVRVELERDPAALEGLLSAAATGRNARALGSSELLRSMVATAGADLQNGDPEGRAVRILGAFKYMRARGPGGEDRSAVVLEGWQAASLAGRWLRLSVLAKLRSPGGAQQAAQLLRDGGTSPLLYRQALLTWIAASVGLGELDTPELAAAEHLFGALDGLPEAVRLASRLAQGGFRPPQSWRAPGELPSHFSFIDRAAVLAWWVMLGDFRASADHWRALLDRDQVLWRTDSLEVSRLLEQIGQAHAGVLGEAWALARGEMGTPGARLSLDRSAWLAGLLEDEQEAEVWKALQATFEAEGPDWIALAVKTKHGWNHPEGQAACFKIMEALAIALREERPLERCQALLAALERSVGEMEKAGWELSLVGQETGRRNLAEQWSEQVRRLAERYKRTPLGLHLSLHWPPHLESGIRDLELEERLPSVELRVQKDSPTEAAALRR